MRYLLNKIYVRWLMLRMWANIDSAARAANRRNALNQAAYAREAIRRKAMANDIGSRAGLFGLVDADSLVNPELVIERPSNEPERSLHRVTEEGMLVTDYDVDDPDFKALAAKYGFGDATDHERQATLVTVDATPPEPFDGPDVFEGIHRL